MATRSLSDEVQFLKGIGPKNGKALAKIGVATVGDLLFHIPRRYEDRRTLPPIRQVQAGTTATVRGRLIDFDSRSLRSGMVIQKGVLRDKTGSIALTWFNQPWIRNKLQSYSGEVIAYGPVKVGSYGLELSNPEFEIIENDEDAADFARIIPVYPLTEGVSQKSIRRGAEDALEKYLDLIPETLPPHLRKRYHLLGQQAAIAAIHDPSESDVWIDARRRLVFEEFLVLQLGLAQKRLETHIETGIAFPIQDLISGGGRKAQSESKPQSPANREDIPVHLFAEDEVAGYSSETLWDQIHRILPFELTGAQKRVIGEIFSDMASPHPMNRLVQGDVGSGKTAVAACAMLAAVRSGYQAVMMAPTEILAEQHYANLHRIFDTLGIRTVLMVGKLSAKEKKKARELAQSGVAQIAVGTHALIEEDVKFHKLGFVVVDEQHRFGVLQRAALTEKGIQPPDVLVMTATPIPRTLTMTLYGDLDVSIIDELPPGRKPIKTHWRKLIQREAVYAAVNKLLEEGRQAYFVCPLVSESELMLAQAAEELENRLRTEVYPNYRVGLLHGKMKPAEKEHVMDEFRDHRLDILVSTTVIEVGVDVPNATVMVIEDADRFGLSQLHQLRGRVGRGSHQSFCILLADERSEYGRQRMETMVETNDGFVISQVDLDLRGPGEIAGTRQSGIVEFQFGNLLTDGEIMEQAREAAKDIVDGDPKLDAPEWQAIRERLTEKRTSHQLTAIS